MKLHTISFGCQMNLADSEEMARPLRARGFETAGSLEEADCVLVNTCTIRDHAEHRAVSLLGRLEEWKTPDRFLIVAGCAAERLGGEIKRRFPHVDLVAGARSIERFPELLREALRGRWEAEQEPFLPAQRAAGAGPSAGTAFVTVMRGCNYSCSYCIVPAVRGRESYRSADAILAEARDAVEGGALEVMLVGQTVNSYRSAEGVDFSDLLRRAGAISGLKRLRFMSPHPYFVNGRMIRAMAETPAVCAHLHLPAQSGSDRILKLMKRNYDRAGYIDKVSRLREAMPSIALTTDIIVGFPSETERDFRESLELLRAADIDGAYCFKFSPREGTEAASLPDPVPEETKEERLARLLELVEARSREKAAAMVGRRTKLLLEDETFGRTEGYLKMRLLEPVRQRMATAVVTGAEGAVLVGRSIGEGAEHDQQI